MTDSPFAKQQSSARTRAGSERLRPGAARAQRPTAGSSWHRPLLVLAVVMAALVIPTIVAAAVDARSVTGAEVWLKPLKFEISVSVYALTLSWLIGLLDRFRRVTGVIGTVSAAGLVIEMVIIIGVAALGETSHFNVSTPLHTALWGIMAISIVVVWVATLLVAVLLFRTPLGDPARTLAIRAGAVIAFVGMGLAFLMTSPTALQLADYQGIVGAHTVGVADGGPGLPLLGWSTVAGDLRIPHFVGMHALQVLPVFVIALELLAVRVLPSGSSLATPIVRLRLVRIAVVTFACTLAVLTWQALAGQSIVHPAGPVLVSGLIVAIGCTAAVVVTLALSAAGPGSATAPAPAAAPTPVRGSSLGE